MSATSTSFHLFFTSHLISSFSLLSLSHSSSNRGREGCGRSEPDQRVSVAATAREEGRVGCEDGGDGIVEEVIAACGDCDCKREEAGGYCGGMGG